MGIPQEFAGQEMPNDVCDAKYAWRRSSARLKIDRPEQMVAATLGKRRHYHALDSMDVLVLWVMRDAVRQIEML